MVVLRKVAPVVIGLSFLLQRRARSGNPDFFRVVLTSLHFLSLAVKNLAVSQAALHWP